MMKMTTKISILAVVLVLGHMPFLAAQSTLKAEQRINGKLVSRHTVTGINEENGNTLVSVESTAEATISDPIKDGKYSLTRSTNWQFNATKGRLVSLSMNEDAWAISKLPQGNVPVHQVTTATLSP